MTGSLQVKSGKYYVVLSYKDKSGRKQIKWVKTGLDEKNNKRRAQLLIPEIIVENQYLEMLIANGDTEFGVYAEEWLRNKRNAIEISTYERYMNQVEKQIIPYFGNKQISKITPRDVSVFYNTKAVNGRIGRRTGPLSHQTLKSIASILRSIFRQALIEGIINRNPADNVPLPTRQKTQSKNYVFLNKEQANRLLKVFENDPLHEIVFVTLYYGLRKSEALGLQWRSVDFENNTLKIEHTVVKSITVIEKDSTKSETSNATFTLIPKVKEVLLELKAKQDKNRKLFGDCYIESDYVFTWQDGTMIRPDVLTKSFQRVLKRNGLPEMRFHDLRHSTASMLFDLGWDIKSIQEWRFRRSAEVVIADIETTGNIYTHISTERKKLMSTKLNDFIEFS